MRSYKANLKNINIAANLLLKGGIVAFPTETVYGLGALASDKKAIERGFRAEIYLSEMLEAFLKLNGGPSEVSPKLKKLMRNQLGQPVRVSPWIPKNKTVKK